MACKFSVALLLFLLFCIYSATTSPVKQFYLNDKTCEASENPLTYEIRRLDCLFKGSGMYEFDSSKMNTVETLTMKRLATSFLSVVPGHDSKLNTILIESGSMKICNFIKAPL